MSAAKPNKRALNQLRVGRLVKAHGLKGGLKLELYTDDPESRFIPGAVFSLQVFRDSPWFGKTVVLKEIRNYSQGPVAFFEGIEDRTQAETLIKAILWVEYDPNEDPDEEDAWYDHQLINLDVIRKGEKIGRVQRVEHLPGQDLLIVETFDKKEVMLPFVKALVPEVSIKENRVVIAPPLGLFEDLEDDNVDTVSTEDTDTVDADKNAHPKTDVESATE